MSKRATSEVFKVSPSSLVLALLLLITLSIGIIVAKGGERQLVTLLLGGDTSAALLQTSQESLGATLSQALGNDVLGRTIVFSVWACVGLLTFVLLGAIQSTISAVASTKKELSYVHQDKQLFTHSLGQKILFRTAVAVGWAIYMFIFLHFIVSLFVAAGYVVINGQASVGDVALSVVATLLLLGGIHVHTIFARLFAGRVRLWGN